MFDPNGLKDAPFSGVIPRNNMPRGTIVIETTFPDQFSQPLDLIDYEHWQGFRRSLHMVLGPNGRLWVACEQGVNLMMSSLDLSDCVKDSPIRISFSWDIAQQKSWLSAEDLKSGQLYSKTLDCAVPSAIDDFARILFSTDDTVVTPAVSAIFVSTKVENIGYRSGLGAGALVETEWGPTPIEQVKAGDLVVTHAGDLVPVVALIKTEVPNFGRFQGVDLRRPFQNLSQTLSVSQDTYIMTDGVDVEYEFGHEFVSLRANHIAPFLPRASSKGAPVALRYQLLFSSDLAYRVAGISVHALSVVHDLRDKPLHRRTQLSHVSPVAIDQIDTKPTRKLLSHEATALLSGRYINA
ncbi:Hint domain-containing protein [Pacificibacter maritimus]|uniref:Hint domain-containing protein n=1 Tax=Pacificibacter maritimus TaxID=762213 RepID=UPI001475A4C7|nr:Hint domain-containing protein [Pacificibacter maritimus]